MPALKPSTSNEVRSKFFNTIGIDPRKLENGPSTKTVIDQEWITRRNYTVAKFQELLKHDKIADRRHQRFYFPTMRKHVDEKEEWKPRSRNNTDEESSKKKKVTFVEQVDVALIPMRNEYSNRIKATLWANVNEIEENAARNTVEFLSEGWDWRNVLEEESMYICAQSGERIHPCHFATDDDSVGTDESSMS